MLLSLLGRIPIYKVIALRIIFNSLLGGIGKPYFNLTHLCVCDSQKEFPVPEQFKTVWDGSRLVTEPTEIAG